MVSPAEREFIEEFSKQVNLVLMLDHGGRAGSNFFQCLFDAHQECITSPLVHYVYSYWHSVFGNREIVSAKDAHEFIAHTSYSRFLYHDPVGEYARIIRKIGGDETAPFDRYKFRTLIDTLIAGDGMISRKVAITILYAAYALCRGFDLKKAKYIQINDAVSRRDESVLKGFSLSIVDQAVKDFPQAVILALLRDPRAQYASTRHQMVNEFGNNYDLHPGKWRQAFKKLWCNDISLDHGPAHFCLLYQIAAYRALMQSWRREKGSWIFLKNEDFNTNFLPTMMAFCTALNIQPDPEWIEKGDNYKARMMGRPWAGTGAYSSRYQNVTDGPLANDTQEQVVKMTGPNKYVTERWKTKIPQHEQAFLEHYFQKEIYDLSYPFLIMEEKKATGNLLLKSLMPWSGEWPSVFWIKKAPDFKSKNERIFYVFTFFPFYILSRIKLFLFDWKDNFFQRGFPAYDRNEIPFIKTDKEKS